jgi:polar amino acid transport system permease protein
MAQSAAISTNFLARGSFRVRVVVWWIVWLALLLLLFTGLQFSYAGINIRTLRVDGAFILTWLPFITRGIGLTLSLSIVSILCATILAFVSALAGMSRFPSLVSLSGLYVSLMRGTPLFLQFLFVYLALPQLGLVLDSFTSAVIALSLNYGAYMSEIFRAGIQAVGRGQSEASLALGLSRWQTLRYVVLPQAFRIVIPDIGNQFIAMQKDTALASAIALSELMGLARQAGAPRQKLFEALLIAAVWYWIMTIVLSFFQARLERRMGRGEHRPHEAG